MVNQLHCLVFGNRPPTVTLSAQVLPELHEEIREQARRNDEQMGDLLARLIHSAPAAAWNKPNEGKNHE